MTRPARHPARRASSPPPRRRAPPDPRADCARPWPQPGPCGSRLGRSSAAAPRTLPRPARIPAPCPSVAASSAALLRPSYPAAADHTFLTRALCRLLDEFQQLLLRQPVQVQRPQPLRVGLGVERHQLAVTPEARAAA